MLVNGWAPVESEKTLDTGDGALVIGVPLSAGTTLAAAAVSADATAGAGTDAGAARCCASGAAGCALPLATAGVLSVGPALLGELGVDGVPVGASGGIGVFGWC
jgi:hypothetical protein